MGNQIFISVEADWDVHNVIGVYPTFKLAENAIKLYVNKLKEEGQYYESFTYFVHETQYNLKPSIDRSRHGEEQKYHKITQ